LNLYPGKWTRRARRDGCLSPPTPNTRPALKPMNLLDVGWDPVHLGAAIRATPAGCTKLVYDETPYPADSQRASTTGITMLAQSAGHQIICKHSESGSSLKHLYGRSDCETIPKPGHIRNGIFATSDPESAEILREDLRVKRKYCCALETDAQPWAAPFLRTAIGTPHRAIVEVVEPANQRERKIKGNGAIYTPISCSAALKENRMVDRTGSKYRISVFARAASGVPRTRGAATRLRTPRRTPQLCRKPPLQNAG